jgi:hypothetical protein
MRASLHPGLILAAAALVACGSDDATDSAAVLGTSVASSTASASGAGGSGGAGGSMAAPETLVLTGNAEGSKGDETVICTLGGVFADIVDDGTLIDGTFSGEFLRRVELGKEAFAFEPFLGGPASITRGSGDSAELRLVGDQPTDASRYWLELETLEATEVMPYVFEGTFSCAPLDLDETVPPDLTTTVTGEFRLAPPD